LDGSQNSSTCSAAFTQSDGNDPYSHIWITTSFPSRGLLQFGGHA
jgi:hypothetical protein